MNSGGITTHKTLKTQKEICVTQEMTDFAFIACHDTSFHLIEKTLIIPEMLVFYRLLRSSDFTSKEKVTT